MNASVDSVFPEKYRILSGSALKMIAVITMLIDHIGAVLLSMYQPAQKILFTLFGREYTVYLIFRDIGRAAFPIFFIASRILPMVASSGARPRPSPQAARTAGATCATTILSLSSMALHTFSVSSLALKAPTGQWVIHWPQREQSASSIFL